MCCPVVPALRCEILIGQPQADAFDYPCSTCHVYIHVLTFTAAVHQCMCEILRFEKCIGSYDIHSREIRNMFTIVRFLSVLHIFHLSPEQCNSVTRFNLPSIHFKSQSRFSKNTYWLSLCMTIYNQNNHLMQYLILKR